MTRFLGPLWISTIALILAKKICLFRLRSRLTSFEDSEQWSAVTKRDTQADTRWQTESIVFNSGFRKDNISKTKQLDQTVMRDMRSRAGRRNTNIVTSALVYFTFNSKSIIVDFGDFNEWVKCGMWLNRISLLTEQISATTGYRQRMNSGVKHYHPFK